MHYIVAIVALLRLRAGTLPKARRPRTTRSCGALRRRFVALPGVGPMPHVVVIPDVVSRAATDLAHIGSPLRAATAAAAAPTRCRPRSPACLRQCASHQRADGPPPWAGIRIAAANDPAPGRCRSTPRLRASPVDRTRPAAWSSG
ncbi:hypothetical protein B1T45_13565 [Mycobacterium kansasii]|nr:hypothetical protein B1T43_13050 [Mycobacterium kansasii]ARG62158.1 hypothetical protein B1T45_13565 [Mycobacterium kansasii]ARG69781.1 hypothetical protein B1T47_12770 [Mycobacterium kansasii]ARG75602.1 hypothetical protein B1T51_15295 [Mycobacterium kansasii]ARG81106.1 hypothetical protein B1T52_15575 [Mycobacterium kansasii]